MKHIEETFVHSYCSVFFFSLSFFFSFFWVKGRCQWCGVELQLSGAAFELFGQAGLMRVVWTFWWLPGDWKNTLRLDSDLCARDDLPPLL